MFSRARLTGRVVLPLVLLVANLGMAAAAGSRIQGSEWGFAGDPPDARRFVQFSGNGRMLGFGGCNRFSGSYTLAGEHLSIGAVVATRRACAEDVMQREDDFFRALEATRSVQATQLDLVLKSEDGTILATLVRRGAD